MGGKGSGGARIGSGRKREIGSVRWYREQRRLAVEAAAAGQAPPATAAAVHVPGDLTERQAEIWRALAPHAAQLRTLTPATAHAFAGVCEAIAIKVETWHKITAEGLTVGGLAHPLLPTYRGLLRQVDAGLRAFGLLPVGRPVEAAEAPVDAFAEFAQPLELIRGGRV